MMGILAVGSVDNTALDKCLKESYFQCPEREKIKRRKTSYESFWIPLYCLKSLDLIFCWFF